MKTELEIENSYRIIFICCILFIISVIGVSFWQTNELRCKQRIVNTENDSLHRVNDSLRIANDSISNFRHFYSEHNQQEISAKIKRDKEIRVKEMKILKK